MAYASYFQDIYHQAQIALQRIVFHLKNFSGQNGVNTFHTIGGLSSDISNEWITDSLELLKFLDDDYLPFNYLALKSGFWSNKLKQKGIIHNVIALDFSLSGPNARALGINYDIRKNHPYYFYKDVTFEVPLGVNGDTLDRFLIRLEEISQSTSIIAQVLENLPTDKVNEKINDMVTKEEYLNNILSIKSAMTTKDFNYSSIEGVNGELGLSLFTTANGINRAKLKTGDFGAVMALNQILAEISIENASLVISSLNLSIQGVER
jgi:NADH-quinone oxidoreductase subunit C/D